MKIAFIIARVGNERNLIQKMSMFLVAELEKLGDEVTVFPFTRKTLTNFFLYKKLKKYDCVLIANVGLQCAYISLYKRLGLIKKPFIAISFGSDIREVHNRLINIFNRISKPAINLLIVINPDLVQIAEKRGYKNVKYIHSWAGGIEL